MPLFHIVNLIRFGARRIFIMDSYCCCCCARTHIFNNNYFVRFELWIRAAPNPYVWVQTANEMPMMTMWMELSLVIRSNKWNAWIYVRFNVLDANDEWHRICENHMNTGTHLFDAACTHVCALFWWSLWLCMIHTYKLSRIKVRKMHAKHFIGFDVDAMMTVHCAV